MWLPVTTAPISFGLDLSIFFMTMISPHLTFPAIPPPPVTALAVFENAWLYVETTISFGCPEAVAPPMIPSSLRKISSAAAAGPLTDSPAAIKAGASAQNLTTFNLEISVGLLRDFIRYSFEWVECAEERTAPRVTRVRAARSV